MTATSNIHVGLTAYANGTFAVGQRCSNAGNAYQCTTGGTASVAPTGTGSSISGGGAVVFKWLSAIDYTTLATWAAGIPATLTQPVVGLIWNNGVVTSGSTLLTLSGNTTSATNTITLQPAPGEGFRDNANAATNALSPNVANGVLLRVTGNYANCISGNDQYVTLFGLQIIVTATGGGAYAPIYFTGANAVVDSCILSGSSGQRTFYLTSSATLRNSLIIESAATNSAAYIGSNNVIVNCTIVAYSDKQSSGSGITTNYAASSKFTNNAVIGFSGASSLANGSGNNNAFYGSTPPAALTSNVTVSGYGTNVFVSPASTGTPDFRPAATSPLVNAGATDTTDVPSGLDIIGQARTGTWTVGAFQYVATGGGALAGAASGTSSATGTLKGSGALAGTAAGAASATGALGVQTPEIATGNAAFGFNAFSQGPLSGDPALPSYGMLAGTASGTSSGTGTLSGRESLTGTASGASSDAGTLTGAQSLAGAASGTGAGTGTLSGAEALSGSAAGASSGSGSLSGATSLSGSASGAASGSGSLSGKEALSGSASGTSTAAGTLAGTEALSGSTSGTSTASGNLVNAQAESGTATGTSSASGTLGGTGAISGAAAGQSSDTGVLGGKGALAGSAAGAASGSGTLANAAGMAGSAAGASSASGTLTGAESLSGGATGASSDAGTLTGAESLSGAAAGQSSSGGTLSGKEALSGVGAGQGSATGTLANAQTGAMSGQAAGQGFARASAGYPMLPPGRTSTVTFQFYNWWDNSGPGDFLAATQDPNFPNVISGVTVNIQPDDVASGIVPQLQTLFSILPCPPGKKYLFSIAMPLSSLSQPASSYPFATRQMWVAYAGRQPVQMLVPILNATNGPLVTAWINARLAQLQTIFNAAGPQFEWFAFNAAPTSEAYFEAEFTYPSDYYETSPAQSIAAWAAYGVTQASVTAFLASHMPALAEGACAGKFLTMPQLNPGLSIVGQQGDSGASLNAWVKAVTDALSAIGQPFLVNDQSLNNQPEPTSIMTAADYAGGFVCQITGGTQGADLFAAISFALSRNAVWIEIGPTNKAGIGTQLSQLAAVNWTGSLFSLGNAGAVAQSQTGGAIKGLTSPGMGFAKVWQISGRTIANVLGLPFAQYRPAGTISPLTNQLTTINVWVTGDSKLMAIKGLDRAKPDETYAGLDPALTQVGDYLVGAVTFGSPPDTFFIASQDVPMPIRLVRCDRVLSFQRAPVTQNIGGNPYGGATIADRSTILTGWPAGFVQGTKGESPAPSTKLPGDVRLPWWTAMLPATPSVTLNMGDHATDDLGRDFTVSSAELTVFGWRLTLMLSST